jgi:PAS domain S-box-containing protein
MHGLEGTTTRSQQNTPRERLTPSQETTPSPIKVLLVEDNPTDVLLLRAALEMVRSPSFQVTQVGRRSEALHRLAAECFDVVLLDLSLPDSLGLDTFTTLYGQASGVPIVVLTGLADEAVGVGAVQAGAQDYLLKGQLQGDSLVRAIRYAIERQRAEEALRQQRDWFDVTLSSLGEAVLATDTRGIITFLNPVAEQLTGWPRQEALGRPSTEVFQIVHEHTRQSTVHPIVHVLQEGHTVELTTHTLLLARDGKEVMITESGAPIRTADGVLLGAVLVFRDMTRDRQMEEELLRARKIESVGVLAGGIAHDFNNLLTGIMGNISLAKLLAESHSKIVARLTEAEKACERATALTHQLLTFAKGGAPVRQTVSLAELLHESVGFALHGAKVRGDLHLAEDLWPVDVDAGQINQVLHNVVLNAVQAMPAGGRLTVRAENVMLGVDDALPLPEGRYIKIAVQDHGCGIPKDLLANIFDPYFTTKEQGSGLGLTTAYAIVAKHEGHMTVESEMGVGTTVVVYLPASSRPFVPAPASPGLPPAGQGRILVMDDEAMIRDLLQEILSGFGYHVVCVGDGSEAVAAYQRAQEVGQPFAAVILDHTIPGGMGGLDALACLRALDPHIIALLSSGYANDPVMATFAQHGFSGVVSKPYTVQKLQEVLQRVLQRRMEN